MMIIRRAASSLRTILSVPKQQYHILSLLQSKYEEQQIKLNPRLFPLYVDRLKSAPFNERFLIVLAVDCFRTSQPQEQFRQIVAFAMQNLDRFQSRITIVVLLNQIYLYKAGEKNVVDKLIRRAFEIEEKEDSGYPYYNLKLLILISQLIGLQNYPQQLYMRIDYKRFKPLTIAMVLQLFYQKKLQKTFKLTDQLVDMFVACESFIPFADVHHLSYAIRKVNHPKFRECFFRVRKRIQDTLGKNESRDSGHKQEATKDKEEQKQKGNKWTTDEELLALFRKNIQDKYRLVQ